MIKTNNSVLLLAQFFAVMPMDGITAKTSKRLKFKWLDLRTLHTLIIMLGILVMIILSIHWAMHQQTMFQTVGKHFSGLFDGFCTW